MGCMNDKIRNHPGFIAFKGAGSPVNETEVSRVQKIDTEEKNKDMSYAKKSGGDTE